MLSLGSLGQLEHRSVSDTSEVVFGKKAIASTSTRTMLNKKQHQKVRKRVECCCQTISKEQIMEKLKALGQTLTNGCLR